MTTVTGQAQRLELAAELLAQSLYGTTEKQALVAGAHAAIAAAGELAEVTTAIRELAEAVGNQTELVEHAINQVTTELARAWEPLPPVWTRLRVWLFGGVL